MKSKVSIIVPIYNVEKYLSKCLDSITNQTYKNIEIILVDDGSKDNSGKICDKYSKKDKRIKVIHKPNGGVSSARNAGLENVTGDYVCFVDGDDLVAPDYVEYLLNLAVVNNVPIALTTKMFSNFQNIQIKKDNIKICFNEETLEKILCYKIPIGVYCKIFKTKFLKENKIKFLSDLFIGEGFNFNTTAFQNAEKIAIGNRKIYFYRRDNSTSATTVFSSKKGENALYAIDKIKENLIIKTKRIYNALNFAEWRTSSDVFDSIELSNSKNDNKELYNRCVKIIKKNWYYCLKVPTSSFQRVRAVLMAIYPKSIPLLLKLRRKIYKIKI